MFTLNEWPLENDQAVLNAIPAPWHRLLGTAGVAEIRLGRSPRLFKDTSTFGPPFVQRIEYLLLAGIGRLQCPERPRVGQ